MEDKNIFFYDLNYNFYNKYYKNPKQMFYKHFFYCIIFHFHNIFVFTTEFYVDSSIQSSPAQTGTSSDPFGLLDDAIFLFSNKSFVGDIKIYLISNENGDFHFFSNETLVKINEGSNILIKR